jgi:fibronectin-binding autotransporter adhesin
MKYPSFRALSFFRSAAFPAALFVHFAAPSAFAIPYYWDNDGATAGFGTATGTWTVPTVGDGTQGWSTDASGASLPANVTTTTADALNFGNTATGLATGTITVTGTVDTNSLTFASGSGAITLNGGTIALGGTTPRITVNRVGQVINSALTLDANTSLVAGINSASIASLNGAIGGTGNLTITTASVGIGSSGTNIGFTLGGASTYTGTTLITSGNVNNVMNVKASVANALPASTVLTLDGGNGPTGTSRQVSYELAGNNQTLAGLTNVTRTGRVQRILNSTGTATLTISNTSPASSSFGGNINGTGLSLAKTGTGTQILRAGNTLTGNTTVSGGKLIGVVGGNCASSKVVVDNTLGTYGVSITDNTKTWTIKELATTAAGTLEFDFAAVAPSTTVSPLTITVPTLLTGLADFTAATPKVHVNVNSGLLPGTYPLITWDAVSGTIPTTAGLTVSNVAAGTAASLEVSGNTLNLVISSTAVGIVKANNTDNLNLGSSWVGGVAPSTADVAKWNNVVTSANTTVLGADTTWAGISIENPTGLVTINGTNTLTLGATAVDIDMNAATANLAVNCPLALGGDNAWNVADARSLTLAGKVSGAFGFTKLGAGTTLLSSSANDYTGNTTVTAGTLRLGANNVIPHGAGGIAGNVVANGTLDLNGKSDSINGLSGSGIVDNTGAAAATLGVGNNSQTTTFSGIIQSTTGNINLIKTGNGTLTLTGANTFTGAVTINASTGILALGNVAPLNNVTGITIGGGSTLRPTVANAVVNAPITLGAVGTISTINAPNAALGGTTSVPFTLGGVISGAGNLTLSGVEATNAYGAIILNAASVYTGATLFTTASTTNNNNANLFVRLGVANALPVTTVLTLDGGDGTGGGRFCELNLFGNDQTLAGLTNVSGRTLRNQEVSNSSATAATLTLNNTADSTFSGRIGGGATENNLGLTKSGTAIFTISGANTYTGPTTITGGTLALGALNTLPDASPVSIAAGTLSAATAGTESAGTLNVTGAAVINLGTDAVLAFADSSAVAWTGNLNLTGTFVSGTSLRFGDGTGTGLTPAQLASISATGYTGFALNGSGFLTATPSGGGFASWITGSFAGGTVPVDKRGPNDDFDNDGISNLVEYAVDGQDPTLSNANIGSYSANTLSFTKRAGTSGLTYAIQDSTDLGISDPWSEVIGGSYVNNATTISATLTPGTPAKNFLRLQVISN